MQGICKGNYIKLDTENSITVFLSNDRKNEKNVRRNDRGDDVNLLCYALNELSRAIHENPDIHNLKMTITNKEFNKLLATNIITDTATRIYGLKACRDLLLSRIKDVTIFDPVKGYITSLMIFKYVQYKEKEQEIELEFNDLFIEYMKDCRELTDKDTYTLLYVDVAVSLRTLNSKIMWSILCRYNAQLDKYGHTNDFNIETIKQYIAPYKYRGNKKVYTMLNTDFVNTVNRAIQEINTLLAYKCADNDKLFKGYEVEWAWDSTDGFTDKKGKLQTVTFKKVLLNAEDFIEAKIEVEDKPIKSNYSGATKQSMKDLKNLKAKEQPKVSNHEAEIKEIIDYLNEKAGTKYRYTTKSTVSHINARLKEGYTVEDFKHVIDVKVAEWKGTEMQQYIRPETLFSSKFEGYVNQPISKKQLDHHHNIGKDMSAWEGLGNGGIL